MSQPVASTGPVTDGGFISWVVKGMPSWLKSVTVHAEAGAASASAAPRDANTAIALADIKPPRPCRPWPKSEPNPRRSPLSAERYIKLSSASRGNRHLRLLGVRQWVGVAAHGIDHVADHVSRHDLVRVRRAVREAGLHQAVSTRR